MEYHIVIEWDDLVIEAKVWYGHPDHWDVARMDIHGLRGRKLSDLEFKLIRSELINEARIEAAVSYHNTGGF